MQNQLANLIKQINLEINIKLINFQMFNRINMIILINNKIRNKWNLKNLKIKRYILINKMIILPLIMIKYIKQKIL